MNDSNPNTTTRRHLSSALCFTALLSASELAAQAQTFTAPLHIFYGEPSESTNMFEANYVSMDGLAVFSPLEYFYHDSENHPSIFENENTDNFLSWIFKMAFDYYAPSGDVYGHIVGEGQPQWTPYVEELERGQHRIPTRAYYIPEPDGEERRLGRAYTTTHIFVPTLHQIPYHAAIEVFEFENEQANQRLRELFDMAGMADKLEFDLSLRATGHLHDEDEKNFGAAAWYELMFNGFLDSIKDGEITEPGQLASLPGGITFVKNITYCNKELLQGVAGCAILGGTKIAIDYDVLAQDEPTKLGVLLHEIGHTQGLDHVNDPENLMYEESGNDTIALTVDQAAYFGRQKRNGYTGGYTPWEKEQ